MSQNAGSTPLFAVFVLAIMALVMTMLTLWKMCSGGSEKEVAEKRKKSIVDKLRKKISTTNIMLLLGWVATALLFTYVSEASRKMKPFDPFEILQLSSDATEREVKKAYRKMSLIYHPDKNPDPAAHAFFTEHITKAYKALTDETARNNYEKYGHPDGPQSMDMGVALPEWAFSKDSKTAAWLLAALLGGGVLVPLAVAAYFLMRESVIGSSEQVQFNPRSVQWKGKGKKKKGKGKDSPDLYALLGLQNERWAATESQIKNAYREVAMECEGKGRAIEDNVQEAYKTLSTPSRRREYDSTDVVDFDDTLPSDCDPVDFFKVFGPAFRRNARWSVHQPVPDLGNESAAWKDLDKFYTFWFKFSSWRDFPHPDEEDVDRAESREHRRYIERYNSKLREQGKKEEKMRLREFVEAAYEQDPRVIRKREEDRAERERRKQQKVEEAKRRQEEVLAKQREEEEKKAAEVAATRHEEEERKAAEAVRQAEAEKQRDFDKKALQRERKRLRGLLGTGAGAGPGKGNAAPPLVEDEDDVERLAMRLGLADMQALCKGLSDDAAPHEERCELVQTALARVSELEDAERSDKERATIAAQRAADEAKKMEAAQRQAARAEWEEDEVRLLHKAMTRFPVGTAKRWEAVAAYVRTRTVDEVLDMVKHGLKAGKFAPKDEQWKLNAKKGSTEIGSAPDSRLSCFSDVDVSISGKAADVLVGNAAAEAAVATAAAEAAGVRPAAAAAAVAAAAAAANGSSTTGATAAAANGAADAAAGAAEWSEEQELALVKALKQVSKDASDRWEQISSQVPGKSKAACMRRFKDLKTSFKAKKATAA